MKKYGKITPSAFAKMMTKGRGKDEEFGKTAMEYAHSIALERMGVELPEITAKALEWGNDFEDKAIEAYETKTGLLVIPTDTIQHPEFDYVSGTPDGLVGEDGLIEVKCPYNPVNHLYNIKTNQQAYEDYYYQIQGYMWITGRQWCDFVSYDPRFPDNLKLHIHRMQRDQEVIDVIQDRCQKFELLINKIVIQ
jgi:putative phage-type endonuclease